MTSFNKTDRHRYKADTPEARCYARLKHGSKHSTTKGPYEAIKVTHNGDESTFKYMTWINMQGSHWIPWECLLAWCPWRDPVNQNQNLALYSEAYEELMEYRRIRIPFLLLSIEDEKRIKEEKRIKSEQRTNDIRKEKTWRRPKSESTALETPTGLSLDAEIIPRVSGAATSNPWSNYDQDAMRPNYKHGTRGMQEQKQKPTRTCPWADVQKWRDRLPKRDIQQSSKATATSADEPPQSNSGSSAMIPTAESYTQQGEAALNQETNATQACPPSRAPEAQLPQEPGIQPVARLVPPDPLALPTSALSGKISGAQSSKRPGLDALRERVDDFRNGKTRRSSGT